MQTYRTQSPLEIKQISHRFGDTVALENVSFKLANNGITALLGSNGAGKTTIINCALGLLRPSNGSVKVLGHKAGTRAAKQKVGLMLQDTSLPDLLTAREHISLFSSYYQTPLAINEVIQKCDLSRFADKKYKHLSGGQKRRVQFALAVLGRPKLVFLDEPTTGLDVDARRVLWNTIRELRESGTSIVLTTHYLEEADALADDVIVLDQGKLVTRGTTNEIRSAVSGSVIRCQTDLDITAIKQLVDVRSAQSSGRYQEIVSSNGANTLRALLTSDAHVSDITVQKPSLEDAFKRIKNNHGEAA